MSFVRLLNVGRGRIWEKAEANYKAWINELQAKISDRDKTITNLR